MRNIQKKYYLSLLFIFAICSFNSIHAQSLYEDAIQFSEAVEKDKIKVIVNSTGYNRLTIIGEDGLTISYPFLPPLDSVILYDYGEYTFENQGLKALVTVEYDTVATDFVVLDELTAFSIDNQVEMVSLKEDGEVQNVIPKTHFYKLHSILGSHLESKPSPEKSLYNLQQSYSTYNDNPFLNRLMKQSWFQSNSTETMLPQVSEKINSKQESHNAFYEKLYMDSINSAEQLLTVQNVQELYEEPAEAPVDQLVDLSYSLESSEFNTGNGFNTQAIIAGLSDFIAERAQEEFTIIFLENFADKLNDPNFAELHTLFPQSKDFLNQIDIVNYKSLLMSAREVFTKDIKNLSFNMPRIFDLPKNEHLKNMPEIYDMLIVYSIVDLIYRDVPLDDILPVSYRKVFQRTAELDKAINLRLANNEKATNKRKELSNKIAALEKDLVEAKNDIIEKQLNLEIQFAMAALDEEAPKEAIDQLYFDYYKKVEPFNKALEYAWDTLDVIPANLLGRKYYDDLMVEPSIEKYDLHFKERPDSDQLIAAGLQLSRLMVGGVSDTPSKAEVLAEWTNLLQLTENRYNRILDATYNASTAGIQDRLNKIEAERKLMQSALDEELIFWEGQGAEEHDSKALMYLKGTLNDEMLTNNGTLFPLELLENRYAKYQQITEVIAGKMEELATRFNTQSPLAKKLLNDETTVIDIPASIDPKIDALLTRTSAINKELKDLDKLYCGDLIKARKNTEVLSKIMELTSHMMYFMQFEVDGEQRLMTKTEFAKLAENQVAQDAFLGLIYQRLSNLYSTDRFSNRGVAALTTSFVNALTEISYQRGQIALKKTENERLNFKDYYPFIKVAINLMTQVLETPTLINPTNNQQVLSLIERDTNLAYIPHISRNTLDLFDNIYSEQYNFAIYNVLELYKVISERNLQNCYDQKGKKKKDCYENERIRNGILLYGTFMADMAMAQQPEEVKRALQAVALPAGSSRVKREYGFNISINSYFGIGLGNEVLTNPQIIDNQSATVGLSVPVGVAVSWKFNKQRRDSWSFFAPILDLGAVTAFRIEEQNAPLPELSLKNIISPGGYLLYNIPKSPFSVGAGVQYGPQVRTISQTLNNGDVQLLESGAWRYMLMFGVDVPIFNLVKGE